MSPTIEEIVCNGCGVIRRWRGSECLTVCECMKEQEPNMDAVKTREINVLVKENRRLIEDCLSLVTALSEIARPRDCGCMPCKDQCVSREALLIEAEEMRETARAALMRTPIFERGVE